MKVVIGVDLSGAFEPALETYRRLEFGPGDLYLLNVVEPILPDGAFPELAASSPLMQILGDLTQAGEEILAKTKATLEGQGDTVHTAVLMGNAAGCLIQSCKNHGADLAIVGAQRKSLVESFFTGSVTKALTTECRSSVLIGKEQPGGDGLTVVFAHDLSEYCWKALDHFVAMKPKGIKKAIVVTADTTDPALLAVAEHLDTEATERDMASVRETLSAKQDVAAEKLKALGCPVRTVLSEGRPDAVVREALADANADLLVLGAHGHGFIERVFVGSFALHQVVREPHNVLIVRA